MTQCSQALAVLATVLAMATSSSMALAHTSGVSSSELTCQESGSVLLRVSFAATDLLDRTSLLALGSATLEPQEKLRLERIITQRLREGIVVRDERNEMCQGHFQDVAFEGPDGLRASAELRCPSGCRTFSATHYLLTEMAPGHRHLASVTSGPAVVQRLLHGSDREIRVSSRSGEDNRLSRVGVPSLVGLGFLVAVLATLRRTSGSVTQARVTLPSPSTPPQCSPLAMAESRRE